MSNSKKKNLRKNVLNELKISFQDIKKDYKYIKSLSKEGEELLGSSEWLLDNIYLIEKEYKSVKDNMPYDYFSNLPPEETSKNEVNPRVYLLAKEYINKKDGLVEEKDLVKYINNKKVKLTMGELWAFPIMLRAALIVNLSKITKRLSCLQKEKLDGKNFATKLLENKQHNNLEEIIKSINESKEEFSPLFVGEAIKFLKDNSIEEKEIYIAIKERLNDKEEEGLIKNAFVEGILEGKISSIIKSLREIDGANWRSFFDNTSEVEKILNNDPSGTYKRMDFQSKDYYRHKIEYLSRKLQIDEILITEKAYFLAEREKEGGKRGAKSHVGYYLVDDGVRELSKSFNNNSKIKNAYSQGIYITCIAVLTAFIVAITLIISSISGANYTTNKYILLSLLIIIPSSEISISFINWLVGKKVSLRHVPKLDYSKGIPDEDKTIVIIPSIVTSGARVKELMEQLEVFYLGNKDKNLYFALLNDFTDANKKEVPQDKEIISQGIKIAHKLNKKYFDDRKHFFFLNRERVYNPKEKTYMGKERKRGKIMEFISLLKGEENHSFSVISSPISHIKDAKYIITLDADTFLPREMAPKLIGAMSHILNKAKVSDGVVKRGYGIIQPKVTISYESKNKSRFSEIFGGEEG
ncbi:MAG: GH36-type glycosyl hydrolase domain-containing protein, partial [Clostridium sp.]